MSKSKAQGTAFESWLVQYFRDKQLQSSRFAEGGSKDIGDLWVDGFDDIFWVVEAKATQTLNVTRVLGKAIEKGGPRTVLIWKRLIKTGKKVRQSDGEKVVVVLSLDLFTTLLKSPSAVADRDT